MPDLWSTTEEQRRSAASEHAKRTGATLVSVDRLTTGLWVGATFRGADGQSYRLRLTQDQVSRLLVESRCAAPTVYRITIERENGSADVLHLCDDCRPTISDYAREVSARPIAGRCDRCEREGQLAMTNAEMLMRFFDYVSLGDAEDYSAACVRFQERWGHDPEVTGETVVRETRDRVAQLRPHPSPGWHVKRLGTRLYVEDGTGGFCAEIQTETDEPTADDLANAAMVAAAPKLVAAVAAVLRHASITSGDPEGPDAGHVHLVLTAAEYLTLRAAQDAAKGQA